MATVTGFIGNDNVELDNAATEETLRRLLTAVTGMNQSILRTAQNNGGGAGAAQTTQQTAALNQGLQRLTNGGVSAAGAALSGLTGTIGLVASGLGRMAGVVAGVGGAMNGLATTMLDGKGNVSDFYNSLKDLPLGIGLVAQLFGKLAQMQEDELAIYRKLTTAGVNFGGALTDIRKNALNLGLDLQQFGSILHDNAKTFQMMGTTVNDGAESFTKLATKMRNDPVGIQLRSLGITSEQATAGLASYIAMTGGRNRQELQTIEGQTKLTKSAADYMIQLDALAAITGESKDEQEKKLKAELEEASFSAFMATKSDPERKAIQAAMTSASALYGKAGTDIVKATAMGVAVQGEAGQKLTALSSDTARAIQRDLEIRKRGGDQSAALNVNEAQGRSAAGRDLLRYAGAVGTFGNALTGMDTTIKNVSASHQAGLVSEKDFLNQRKEVETSQIDRTKSLASQAAEAEKAFKEAGAAIYDALKPAIEVLSPLVNKLAISIMNFVSDNMPKITDMLTKVVKSIATFVQNVFSDEGRLVIQKRFEIFIDRMVLGIREHLGKSWLGQMLGGIDSSKGPRGGKSDADKERENIDKRAKQLDDEQINIDKKRETVAEEKAIARSNRPGVKGMLDQIAKGEGTDDISAKKKGLKSGYDVSLGYGAYGGGPNKDISTMSMAEVKAYQKKMLADPKNTLNSSAVGKYQFISGTLAELQKEAGLKDTDTFDAATQDRFGEMLLKRRGLDKYQKGLMSPDAFQGGISKEWASVADPTTKKSYYGQHTGTSDADIKAALEGIARPSPKAATGGFFSGPGTGYNVQLHGKELVIPMNNESQVSKAAISPGGLTMDAAKQTGKTDDGLVNGISSNEMLLSELQTLNKNTEEMLRWVRETAVHSERNVDATKALNGNLFA